MAITIKDGTGKAFEQKVDSDNRAHTKATTSSEEHHQNDDHQKAWTVSFDAVDPTDVNDYFLNMKNTATAVRAISRIVVTSTVAGYLEVQRVTGTSIGGAAEEINSWTFGASDPADFTAESAVDITGLTDAGVLRFVRLQANITEYIEFPQGLRLLQNEQCALLWTPNTGVLTGNVDLYEEA